MKALFSALLRDWAQPVTILRPNGRAEARAFVQPVRSVSQHEKKAHPLGLLSPGQAVYIGPADKSIQDAAILCAGVRWRVRRTETILVGDEGLYTWGVLTREGEDETDV